MGLSDIRKRFSIIIPVMHEAPNINGLIARLRTLKNAGESELIVVDGSAEGDTLRAIAESGDIRCLTSPPCRAIQMNAGAAVAAGDILVFLHVDTHLPDDALTRIGQVMEEPAYLGGAFNLAIDSPRLIFRLLAAAASLRSRLTRIPYGDQAIFIRREAFLRMGCYPEIPILEDLVFMERIKKSGGKIYIIPQCVTTSARRWEKEGLLYGTLRNWFLLAAYHLGGGPDELARYYKNW